MRFLCLIFCCVAYAASASAQKVPDIEFREKVLDELKICLAEKDNSERLVCYDKMVVVVSKLATDGLDESSELCTVEDWSINKRGKRAYITGAATCRSGRMDYRFYNAETEEFIESGFTFLKGYTFQIYGDRLDFPKEVTMKYVIDPR